MPSFSSMSQFAKAIMALRDKIEMHRGRLQRVTTIPDLAWEIDQAWPTVAALAALRSNKILDTGRHNVDSHAAEIMRKLGEGEFDLPTFSFWAAAMDCNEILAVIRLSRKIPLRREYTLSLSALANLGFSVAAFSECEGSIKLAPQQFPALFEHFDICREMDMLKGVFNMSPSDFPRRATVRKCTTQITADGVLTITKQTTLV